MMEAPTHQLILHLFGYPEIEADGRAVHLPRRKSLALLAYLGVRPAGVGREALAALLWPDYDGEQAFAYLRQALWELNKALGKGLISAEGETVGLDPRADLWVDVARYERALSLWKLSSARGASEATRSLEEAVALYRGDFLAGFTLRDSAPFDEWQSTQAEALRRELGEALAALARVYADQGDLDMAGHRSAG
jgi:DNA-binding SARP family transcriptional activator